MVSKEYIEALIEQGRRYGNGTPRVHGNGFIQLDVSDRARLHFWGDPHIPIQEEYTPIHDHVFGFSAHVLKGSILNVEYTIEESSADNKGLYQEWVAFAREGSDTGLRPGGRYLNLRGIEARLWRAPEVYTMERGMLHETIVREPTITVIRKDGPTLAQGGPAPRVLVPWGRVADNAFDRNAFHVPFLWGIIKEIVNV